MSEFVKDSRLTAVDDMQPAAFLAQADDETPPLNANFDTSAGIESYDALERRSPGLAGPTPADSEAIGVASGSAENLSGNTAEVNKVCTPRVRIPLQPRPDSQTSELYNEVQRMIVRRTLLPDSISLVVACWAISTWFQDVFTVLPCLVITGPIHEATVILRVLNELCYAPILLAGFKRGDLKDLNRCGTLLISEESLPARTAVLLGNLTNRDFVVVEQGYYLYCASSVAVYIGEHSAVKRVQNSIYINATVPPLADSRVPTHLVRAAIDGVRQRIGEYRTRHLATVRSLEFIPRGLSAEASIIANALGSCIVDAPQLQTQLVALLKPQARQRIADRSESDEALVLAAVIALCNQDKGHVFAKEIGAEVNRLRAARGEARLVTPEKVGHTLKKLGLYTRRLSHAGNGLILDQPTRKRLREVAAAYQVEDLILGDGNLHCSSGKKNETFREDVEDMKDLPI
jgi:hypothetical protein